VIVCADETAGWLVWFLSHVWNNLSMSSIIGCFSFQTLIEWHGFLDRGCCDCLCQLNWLPGWLVWFLSHEWNFDYSAMNEIISLWVALLVVFFSVFNRVNMVFLTVVASRRSQYIIMEMIKDSFPLYLAAWRSYAS